jgi:hypothetical protein
VGAQRARDGRGAAHHDDAFIAGKLVAAGLDLTHRDQHRAGRVPVLPFAGPSDVEEHRPGFAQGLRSAH